MTIHRCKRNEEAVTVGQLKAILEQLDDDVAVYVHSGPSGSTSMHNILGMRSVGHTQTRLCVAPDSGTVHYDHRELHITIGAGYRDNGFPDLNYLEDLYAGETGRKDKA